MIINRAIVSLCAVLLICPFLLPLFAADDVPANAGFLRLKATYEKELQKITDSDLGLIVTEQDKYLAALKNIQKKMQATGKLDPVLAIEKEIDRFSAAKKISVDNISKDVPELVPLQNAYIKAVEKYSVEQAQKIIALAQNYEKALGNLQEVLTKNNDIRGAIEVKSEKESLTNRAELMAARALVMDAETKVNQEKPPEKDTVKTPGQPNAGEKAVAKPAAGNDTPARKKYTGSPEKRIRQRFDDLIKYILKQDFTHASEFVDPEFVKNRGMEGVRRCFMDVFPFLRFSDDPHRKLSVDSVKVGDKGDTATLIPKLWAGNQWHDLSANKWIETQDDWFIDISDAEKMEPQGLKQLKRAEQIKPGTRKWFKRMPGRK